MTGIKFDQGKDPWHLMPIDALSAVLKVVSFGSSKYGDRNWEQGMDWSRLYSAGMRHFTAWWNGEKVDEETGYSHLWHAACCVLFLIAYEIRGIGKDDRPKEKPLPVKEEVYMDRRVDYAGSINYKGPLKRATDRVLPYPHSETPAHALRD